jgi:hypothetical protein
MKSRIIALLVSAAALVFMGTIKTNSVAQQQKLAELEASKDRGTLRWHAAVARARGQKRVVLPAPDPEYPGADPSYRLKDALKDYSVVVVEPLVQKVLPYSGNSIVTWSRFRILETLVQHPTQACPNCVADPPDELLPIAPDELVVPQYGGSVVIDGVSINMVDERFPKFKKGKKYLLFASRYPSGTALICGGPIGAYLVGEDESIEPITKEFHPLKTDLRETGSSSMSGLRHFISSSKKSEN